MMKMDTNVLELFVSIASGIRWMKASPNKLPAEKLTIYRSIFASLLSFNNRDSMPTKETKLTRITLIKL